MVSEEEGNFHIWHEGTLEGIESVARKEKETRGFERQ